jgi:hypothetical protein
MCDASTSSTALLYIDEGENVTAVKIIPAATPCVPAVPFASVTDKHIQRVFLAIPTRQMEHEPLGSRDWKNLW